jgi:hypothetical protein
MTLDFYEVLVPGVFDYFMFSIIDNIKISDQICSI